MQSHSWAMFLIIFAIPLLAAGVYLLISGLRGRRVGDEPRCAKCGYILLHLASFHCPECGTEIAAWNTVVGERKRRPGRAAMGAVMLALGALPLIPPAMNAVANIRWYQYKPTGYVIDDLDSPPTYLQAIKELQRREKIGELTLPQVQKIADKGLQAQVGKGPAGFGVTRQELLDFLGSAIVNKQVTPEQKERFVDQACAETMVIRPIVVEGDQVPFWLWRRQRWGGGGTYPIVFWYEREDGERRVDGKVIRTGTSSGTGQLTEVSGTGLSVPSGPVGKHTLEVDTSCSIWYGVMSEKKDSMPIGSRKQTASGSYEVVAKEQAPKIERLDSEDLRKQVAGAIEVWTFMLQKNGYLNANFRVTGAPCDLAFSVVAVIDSGETKLGTIACAKGKTMTYGVGGEAGKVKQWPAKVKVILRPSEDVVKMTVDQTSMFSGEVVFEDVEVKRER